MKRILAVLAASALLASFAAGAKTAAIPDRPEKLRFEPLKFEVPDADQYRHVLSNGVPVYIVEDHSLPLVNLSVVVRAGSFLDPEGKAGLASLTGTMLRRGGTEKMSAEEFDERADFLAANISSFVGDISGSASLDCTTFVLDEAMGLFFDMLRSPRFQQDRLDIEKTNLIERFKQRNDDAGAILNREWRFLMFGEDHYSARQATKPSIDAISRDDLVAFHRNYFHPGNFIVWASGDVDTKSLLARLEESFAGWEPAKVKVPWPPPATTHEPVPGVYHVEKDIPQGKVYYGHEAPRWKRWDDPDMYALMVMNDILGGGGFTSRITKKIRSDEGLAYSAGSRLNLGIVDRGLFFVSFQSKNPTVALAAKLSRELIEQMRSEEVSEEELRVSKNSFIDAFPRRFESADAVARTFAFDEYYGRPHSYWSEYRKRIAAVDTGDVLRVAKKYLHPERMLLLVVGKWDEIAPGDPDHRASMSEFYGGKVTHLPLRDPLTMEPLPQR
ncbi:MAG: insulinase family protein [Acidobacteria bacterium]|nr:MAG: insulinase family protein [Acidobacteriota bacterium]